jgi:uncharacterized protein
MKTGLVLMRGLFMHEPDFAMRNTGDPGLIDMMHRAAILGLYIALRRCGMANPFVHIELQTQDLEKSKAFYAGLFDWKLQEIPGLDYTMINVGEGTGGGMMKKPSPDMPDYWLPYIMVDDVAVSTKKAETLGASITQDVTEIPDMGWFSVIKDPTGAVFGLWQAKAGM